MSRSTTRFMGARRAVVMIAALAAASAAESAEAQVAFAFRAPIYGAVAARVTNPPPLYESPTIGTNITIGGLPAGTQLVQVTVDRGNIAIGTNQNCPTTARTVVATSTTSTVGLTFCANQADAPGRAILRAENLSSPGPTAATTIVMAGPPATITATATRFSIRASVTDAGGNPVADGTPVRYSLGQGAAQCGLTNDGIVSLPLSSTALFLLTGSGTVRVTAEWNEANGIIASCAAIGINAVATSVLVPGTTPTPMPTLPAASFAGQPVYSPAKLAQSVYLGGSVTQMEASLNAVGARGAWVQTEGGTFILYIVSGGPVNNAFRSAFPVGFTGATAMTLVGR